MFPGLPSALAKPDPRLYQITILGSLLLYGVLRLDFELSPLYVAAMLATTLGTQYVCGRLWRLPAFDPRSPLRAYRVRVLSAVYPVANVSRIAHLSYPE